MQTFSLVAASGAALLSAIAAFAFLLQLPSSFFPYSGGSLLLDWLAFLVFYLFYALISFPFDLWSGLGLSSGVRPSEARLSGFLAHLGRGMAIQGVVMTTSGLALLLAGRHWGWPGAVACFTVLLVVLAVLRARVSAWLSGVRGAEWSKSTWALALGWTLAGFIASVSLPWCGADTVYALIETLLGCTLWSLFGLLILPRIDPGASRLALFLSWACFGLLSRATPYFAGRPERWAAEREA